MFRLVNLKGRAALLAGSAAHDLADLSGDGALADPMEAIARFDELAAFADRIGDRPGVPLVESDLGPAVPRPTQVFAIGLNYKDHAAESKMALPPAPLTFTKFPSCINRPYADVELSGATVDWEVEIVAVIGTGGKHIAQADAWKHIAGLTLGQDISDRTVQRTGVPPQFSLGKSFTGYGPVGPVLVSVDGFTDPNDIGLRCWVNDELMQQSSSRHMIFPIDELVAYLSSICELYPGDIIFTGTPDGVGMARGRFLAAGDVVVSEADGIGRMQHRFVARPGEAAG